MGSLDKRSRIFNTLILHVCVISFRLISFRFISFACIKTGHCIPPISFMGFRTHKPLNECFHSNHISRCVRLCCRHYQNQIQISHYTKSTLKCNGLFALTLTPFLSLSLSVSHALQNEIQCLQSLLTLNPGQFFFSVRQTIARHGSSSVRISRVLALIYH